MDSEFSWIKNTFKWIPNSLDYIKNAFQGIPISLELRIPLNEFRILLIALRMPFNGAEFSWLH